VQIDTAIKFVLLVVKSHGCLLFSLLGLKIGVSIAYNVGIMEAISSDIFSAENGRIELLVGGFEDIGTGLLHSLLTFLLEGYN
jgi:hypothetical protein